MVSPPSSLSSATVVSNAALATLNVSSSLLKVDPLLHFLCVVSPSFQLTVNVLPSTKDKEDKKKSVKVVLSLSLQDDKVVLTERNAILRCLAGPAFLGRLDKSPFYLCGGHYLSATSSSSSFKTGSPAGCLAFAAMTSWMSLASTVRNKEENENSSLLLRHLDTFLTNRAFLIHAPQPTLADYDLALSILQTFDHDELSLQLQTMNNVHRWLTQCVLAFMELTASSAATEKGVLSELVLPSTAAELASSNKATADPVPVFFYGNDEQQQFQKEEMAVKRDTSIMKGPTASATTASTTTTTTTNVVVTTETTTTTTELTTTAEQKKKSAVDERAPKNSSNKKKQQQKTQQPSSSSSDTNKKKEDEYTISALDIRVGRILKVWNHETADKLYCEEVDIGEAAPRQIASGLRRHYAPERMRNRAVLVVCNLKPRNMMGFTSHGMILCASNDDDRSKVELIGPPKHEEHKIKIGERFVFPEFGGGEPESESRVNKKKIFEKVAPYLRTNHEGIVVWKNCIGRTEDSQVGNFTSEGSTMCDAQVA